MAVGLSVDFVVHFGVGYIHTNLADIQNERKKIRHRYTPATLESDQPGMLFLFEFEVKAFFL